ncbi:hypothetical protein WT37_10435 [Burkholderia territorii]|nr:hypothetical protein WT37_10435 [Burkholderia territorii]
MALRAGRRELHTEKLRKAPPINATSSTASLQHHVPYTALDIEQYAEDRLLCRRIRSTYSLIEQSAHQPIRISVMNAVTVLVTSD